MTDLTTTKKRDNLQKWKSPLSPHFLRRFFAPFPHDCGDSGDFSRRISENRHTYNYIKYAACLAKMLNIAKSVAILFHFTIFYGIEKNIENIDYITYKKESIGVSPHLKSQLQNITYSQRQQQHERTDR